MSFYLLNISVDVADPNPQHIAEDLTYNDQESIIELFVEQVLGYENAINEYDEHDHENHNKKKNVTIDLAMPQSQGYLLDKTHRLHNKIPLPNLPQKLSDGFGATPHPPPKS